MIYLFWVIVILLAFVLGLVVDSVVYQRRLRKSYVSPAPKNGVPGELYGFQVKYSPLVEPGTVYLIHDPGVLGDFMVFNGEYDVARLDEWQQYLERDDD